MWTIAVKSSGIAGDPLPHKLTHSVCSMQQTILSSLGRSLPAISPLISGVSRGGGGEKKGGVQKGDAHLPNVEAGFLPD